MVKITLCIKHRRVQLFVGKMPRFGFQLMPRVSVGSSRKFLLRHCRHNLDYLKITSVILCRKTKLLRTIFWGNSKVGKFCAQYLRKMNLCYCSVVRSLVNKSATGITLRLWWLEWCLNQKCVFVFVWYSWWIDLRKARFSLYLYSA